MRTYVVVLESPVELVKKALKAQEAEEIQLLKKEENKLKPLPMESCEYT